MKTEEELKADAIKECIEFQLFKIQFCSPYNEKTLSKYNEKFKDIKHWDQIGNIKIINHDFDIPNNVKFLIDSAQYVYNTGHIVKSTITETKEEIHDVLKNNNALFMILELLDYSPSKYMIRFSNIPDEDIQAIENNTQKLNTLIGKF